MNKPLILVVEDDIPVRNLITITLKTHGYRYLTAGTGDGAVIETSSHNPDVVLLDLGLPDMDGVDVIRKIRTWSNLPIIVISARSEDTDKIDALDAGADDYLTKPFSVEELLARLRVVERRMALMNDEAQLAESVYTNGRLRIDFAAGCAYMGDKELHLTSTEYKLGSSWENDIASLRVFMATLRKKLESEPDAPQYIQTHIGIGYRMIKAE